ncbi:FGGY-family carbohydrate kinase [Jiangella mangrovi]|uniref:Sugar (Pentulose or hexulose) kinase n=1 Tax=Jiangella mangrovi TaxID=1524084 RepID=A0A7W9LMS0_9ACTN|nr:FGGY family carbohydrate kinase [Jiangella mangrovi]MBB5789550.1 sugar (pentulose or hexulose) kinase [Jiangella mangrovi]
MESRPADVLWAGVDIGTQSVRVLISDDTGRVLALGSAGLTSDRRSPGGRRHEQDPHQWWHAVGAASRQALAGLPPRQRRSPVGAVAICSTSGTVLLTDERGAPITPALMYDDARAVGELSRLRERLRAGGSGAPHAEPDASVQLSWALPKIDWLLRRQATTGRCPGYVAHSADVVAAALVGHRVPTDSSHALKSGYDVVEERWDPQLLDAAGVDAGRLPSVVPPGTRLGTVTAASSAHTGLPAGTPVVAGMTDGCAAQIAAGALSPGSWNSVLGTTLVLKGVSAALIDDPAGAVYSHRHPDGGWLPGGASNVGAGAVAEEFADDDLDVLAAEARRFEPAGAVVYPLTARGERFPFVRPDATRFELGTTTTRAERYAAVVQGVAYVERLCFERLGGLGADVSGDVTITGGATRSAYWNQLRADVLGRPLALPRTPEPAFGMAVLASAPGTTVAARAATMVARRAVVEPRAGSHERLTAGYEQLVAELTRRGHLDLAGTEAGATPTTTAPRLNGYAP